MLYILMNHLVGWYERENIKNCARNSEGARIEKDIFIEFFNLF